MASIRRFDRRLINFKKYHKLIFNEIPFQDCYGVSQLYLFTKNAGCRGISVSGPGNY